MDWAKCVICQADTEEKLRCPLNACSGDKAQAYKQFLNNVKALRQLDSLAVELTLDESITAEHLISHRAHWHKSCHKKFASDKVERAQRKRDAEEACASASGEDIARKRMRSYPVQQKNICIFCAKSEGHLHEFTTLQSDENVRSMATELQDTALLARIAGGDLIAIEAKYTCLACQTYGIATVL